MLNAEAEFQSRRTEVDEYLFYLQGLEQTSQVSVTLMNTMKSSALLMMYNIVESTMANLMQDLFDHIELSKTSFDALNQRMKEVVLGQIKRGSPRLIVEKMNTSASLTFACFEKSEIFSGNLDAKAIREKLREIGVAGYEKYKERALLTVKNERNNLAHGNKSFSDCGKDYTVKELSNFQYKTCSTLEKVIKDLEQFMASKSYA